MIADGLRKVLLAEKFTRFREQMGLVDGALEPYGLRAL